MGNKASPEKNNVENTSEKEKLPISNNDATDEKEQKINKNATLRDITQTVRTYRDPIRSLFQSAIYKHLLDAYDIQEIDKIHSHEMMKHAVKYLDQLTNPQTENKTNPDDDDNNIQDKHAKILLHYIDNFVHSEKPSNPIEIAFNNAMYSIFAPKENDVISTNKKQKFTSYGQKYNLKDYDFFKSTGWMSCNKHFKQYLTSWAFDDLYYKEYENIDNDFQFKIPNSWYHKDKYLRVGILGDWGGGNKLAKQTVDGLMKYAPDIIIHLGDVYYCGTEEEFNINYIKMFNDARARGKHKCPIFSIPGNHDYYCGGKPFYSSITNINADQYVPDWFNNNNNDNAYIQTSSFWGLINDKFYIAGVDTGWDTAWALKQDIADIIHIGKHYPELHKKEKDYHLKHINKAITDGKSIIFNSHHPLFSAFETIGSKYLFKNVYVNDKLKRDFGDVLKYFQFWFWGHEHNFAVYDKYIGLSRGRLVGNGCIPEITNQVHPYCINDDNIPLLKENDKVIQVNKSKLDNDEIYNVGFAYIDLNIDGSSNAYYYEIQQSDPSNPKLVYKEKAAAPKY